MNVIDQIENQGITISLYDGKIKLEPTKKVTPEIVADVKANKTQIICALNNRTNTVHPGRCYACGGQTFWRKKDNVNGRWICKVCHPPALSKDEIEWLKAKLQTLIMQT